MKTGGTGLAAIALIWSGSLLAAGVGTASFDQLDADSDGYITQEEAAQEQALVSRWQELDANEDGTLSRGEFAAFEAPAEGEQPQVTPDGQVSPEEGQSGGQMPGTGY